MKNYIIIAIIIILVIVGYFIYQNIQKPQVADVQKIKVTDNLLTKDKEICSPSPDDGTPYCGFLSAIDEKTNKYKYPDEKYDFARKMKCPPDYINSPEKIVIYDTLGGAVPPSGKSRVGYYCPSSNQFWITDYDSEKVPMEYWYGPFNGYPVKSFNTFIQDYTVQETMTESICIEQGGKWSETEVLRDEGHIIFYQCECPNMGPWIREGTIQSCK